MKHSAAWIGTACQSRTRSSRCAAIKPIEKRRTFLALRAQVTHVAAGSKPRVIGLLGGPKELASHIKSDDWNEYHLIAHGNIFIMHLLNGHMLSMGIDDDAENRRFGGLIGVQVDVGPSMKVKYRKFRLKKL